MTLLATMTSLSGIVQDIAPAFENIGKTAIKAFDSIKTFVNDNVVTPILDKWEELKEWWEGFKESVGVRLEEIRGSVSGAVDAMRANFASVMDGLPAIFTKEFWTDLFTFSIDWDALFTFAIPAPLQLMVDFFRGEGVFGGFTLNERLDLAIGELPEPLSTVVSLLKGTLVQGVIGIGNFIDFSVGAVEGAIGWLMDFIDDPAGSLSATGTAISDFFSNLATELLDVVKLPINGLITAINDVFANFNFSKTFSIAGREFEAGVDLSDWQIPMLAKGGIVTGPTLAMIGEAGPEAVVPLTGDNMPGGNQTFNITVNASGITDRSDKRQMAREIGNMIQQELARNLGGTTMRGRF